jgi:hypothetical protein
MVNSKQKNDRDSLPNRKQEELQKEVAAQRDLMGDAAVDPQPLLNEEKDPITRNSERASALE